MRAFAAGRVLQADGQALPFPNAAFDRVLAAHMLYHVPDREGALAEMRRVLRPGGRLVLATNGSNYQARLGELHRDAALALGYEPSTGDGLCFTLDDLVLVERAFPPCRAVRHRQRASVRGCGAIAPLLFWARSIALLSGLRRGAIARGSFRSSKAAWSTSWTAKVCFGIPSPRAVSWRVSNEVPDLVPSDTGCSSVTVHERLPSASINAALPAHLQCGAQPGNAQRRVPCRTCRACCAWMWPMVTSRPARSAATAATGRRSASVRQLACLIPTRSFRSITPTSSTSKLDSKCSEVPALGNACCPDDKTIYVYLAGWDAQDAAGSAGIWMWHPAHEWSASWVVLPDGTTCACPQVPAWSGARSLVTRWLAIG